MKLGKRIRFGCTGKHLHKQADKKENKIKTNRYLDRIMDVAEKSEKNA